MPRRALVAGHADRVGAGQALGAAEIVQVPRHFGREHVARQEALDIDLSAFDAGAIPQIPLIEIVP